MVHGPAAFLPRGESEYQELLLQMVQRRPRSLEQPFSIWTFQCLADYLAEQTGL